MAHNERAASVATPPVGKAGDCSPGNGSAPSATITAAHPGHRSTADLRPAQPPATGGCHLGNGTAPFATITAAHPSHRSTATCPRDNVRSHAHGAAVATRATDQAHGALIAADHRLGRACPRCPSANIGTLPTRTAQPIARRATDQPRADATTAGAMPPPTANPGASRATTPVRPIGQPIADGATAQRSATVIAAGQRPADRYPHCTQGNTGAAATHGATPCQPRNGSTACRCHRCRRPCCGRGNSSALRAGHCWSAVSLPCISGKPRASAATTGVADCQERNGSTPRNRHRSRSMP